MLCLYYYRCYCFLLKCALVVSVIIITKYQRQKTQYSTGL